MQRAGWFWYDRFPLRVQSSAELRSRACAGPTRELCLSRFANCACLGSLPGSLSSRFAPPLRGSPSELCMSRFVANCACPGSLQLRLSRFARVPVRSVRFARELCLSRFARPGSLRIMPVPVRSVRSSRFAPGCGGLTRKRVSAELGRAGVPGRQHRPFSAATSCLWHSWRMKVNDVLELLASHGWQVVRQKGSHRQLQHPSRPGTVTVAGKPSIDVPPGTLNSILKQAGLKG